MVYKFLITVIALTKKWEKSEFHFIKNRYFFKRIIWISFYSEFIINSITTVNAKMPVVNIIEFKLFLILINIIKENLNY